MSRLSPANKIARANYIKERFKYHKTKNPKWNIIYIIEAVAKDVFLDPTTVTKILREYEDIVVPSHVTVANYYKGMQLKIFA